MFHIVFAPVLALLASGAPIHIDGPRAVMIPQHAATKAESRHSSSQVIRAQFVVTPYCTFTPPATGALVRIGRTGGKAPAGLFETSVPLAYFCDLGPGGDAGDDGMSIDAEPPALAIVDAAATNSEAFFLSGAGSKRMAFSLCPGGRFGRGSCGANYRNSPSARAILPISPSVQVVPLVGYLRSPQSEVRVDLLADDLTVVVYF
jgi:hypothetical protein